METTRVALEGGDILMDYGAELYEGELCGVNYRE